MEQAVILLVLVVLDPNFPLEMPARMSKPIYHTNMWFHEILELALLHKKQRYAFQIFDTLYIFFPNSPLPKWNGSHWETLNTRKEGIYYAQAVRYVPLEYAKTRTLLFPGERLKKIEEVYRFLFTNTYNNRHGYSLIQFFMYISG